MRGLPRRNLVCACAASQLPMQHGGLAAGGPAGAGPAASGAGTAGPGAACPAAARPDSEICMDFQIQTLRADVAGCCRQSFIQMSRDSFRACKFLFTYIFISLHLAPGTWHLALWHLAAGSWHLAPGSWQLAAGSWQLAAGSWHLAPGTWLPAAGRYQVPLQAARCQASGAVCRVPSASWSHGLSELLEPVIYVP